MDKKKKSIVDFSLCSHRPLSDCRLRRTSIGSRSKGIRFYLWNFENADTVLTKRYTPGNTL